MGTIRRKRNRPRNTDIYIVVNKSNQLIDASHGFDLWQSRAFYAILAQLPKNRRPIQDETYRLTCKDFKKMFFLKSGTTYNKLKEAMTALTSKIIKIDGGRNEFGEEQITEVTLIRSNTRVRDDRNIKDSDETRAYVDFQFEPKIVPYLYEFAKLINPKYPYTPVVNTYIAKLKTPHAIQLYEMLSRAQNQKELSRTFTLEKLRSVLKLEEDEYKRFSNFYQKVIERSIEMINNYTDIYIINSKDKNHKIKNGKEVVALRFDFRFKTEEEQHSILVREYGKIYQPSLFLNIDAEDIIEVEALEIIEPQANQQTPYELYPEKYEIINKLCKGTITIETFNSVAKDKTPREIDSAIQFTKERDSLNKAVSLSGMFIFSLEKGIKTDKEQIKEKRNAINEQSKTQERIDKLHARYYTLEENYKKARRARINKIVQEDPLKKIKVIEATRSIIKEQARKGHFLYSKYSEEDIDKFSTQKIEIDHSLIYSPEFVKMYPIEFEDINNEKEGLIAKIYEEGRKIDPNFRIKEETRLI